MADSRDAADARGLFGGVVGVDAQRLACVPEELTAGVSPPTPLGVQVAKTGLRAPDADCDASASSIPAEESRATPARAIMPSFPTVMQSTFRTASPAVPSWASYDNGDSGARAASVALVLNGEGKRKNGHGNVAAYWMGDRTGPRNL